MHINERRFKSFTLHKHLIKFLNVMKHLITIIAAVLITATAFGQKFNVWRTSQVEADALIGNEAYETYMLVTPEYSGIAYSSNKDIVAILCGEGIFDADIDGNIYVLVGLYRNGELTDKVTQIWERGASTDTMLSGQDDGRVIKNWLESGGDIRLIASRYSQAYLDIRIPHRK